jgi:tetratricopeptide (TPR) repeat protein
MLEPINASVARLIQQANAASARGDYAEAQRAAREAVDRASQGIHQPSQVAAHYTLAVTLCADETASMAEAREHATTALELAKAHTDEYYLAITTLARIDASLGNLEHARELNESLLETYRNKNRRHGIAEILRNLGDLALKQDDLPAAKACFQQSLALYESGINDALNQAGLLLSMGTLAYREGDPGQAHQYWQTAYDLGQDLNLHQIMEAAERGLMLLSEVLALEDEPRQDDES